MTQAKTLSFSDNMSMEIEASVKTGSYTSQSDVVRDAMKCLFEHHPELRINVAMGLYKEGKISIGRAAEIAEMSTPDFADAMAERGYRRVITSSKERMKRGLEILRKVKR